jgi:hypothetical protein
VSTKPGQLQYIFELSYAAASARPAAEAQVVSRTAMGAFNISRGNMKKLFVVIVGLLIFVPPRLSAQQGNPHTSVEEIYILRSLRVSRTTPTDYCAERRTGFQAATMEDRYDFKAVTTSPASGEVTNPSGPTVGHLHACFGTTADSLVVSFYTEGDVQGMQLTGRGQCRTTRREFPEAGISLWTCHLDLTALPSGYIGGQLTTNTLASRAILGAETDPLDIRSLRSPLCACGRSASVSAAGKPALAADGRVLGFARRRGRG